jgi:hypothetical protein
VARAVIKAGPVGGRRAPTGAADVVAVEPIDSSAVDGRSGVTTTRFPPALPWRERWLEDESLGLAGRPDIVERVDGVLIVGDFKTGRAEMTDDRRDQLLIYAALVRSTLGELPSRVEIRHADGSAQGFEVQRNAVDEVVHRAATLRQLLGDAATGRGELEATAGTKTCPTCPFRVACRPFFENYQPDWISGHAVVGRVGGTGKLDAQAYLDLEVVAPRWRPKQLRLVGLRDQLPGLGQLVGLSDFEGASAAGFARWNTLTFTWPG